MLSYMAIPKKTGNALPRRQCRYCKGRFQPIREDQRFCKPDHRKAFWRYGGLPYDKMREQIMKDVRRELKKQYDALVSMIGTRAA